MTRLLPKLRKSYALSPTYIQGERSFEVLMPTILAKFNKESTPKLYDVMHILAYHNFG
jgi:hypothetical protein